MGSRACKCTMAAPAATASPVFCCGVTDRCGYIDGVWINPATAHVMMTLRSRAMRRFWLQSMWFGSMIVLKGLTGWLA